MASAIRVVSLTPEAPNIGPIPTSRNGMMISLSFGLALDPSTQTLVFCHPDDHCLYSIDLRNTATRTNDGECCTYSGDGRPENRDGPLSVARFQTPMGIVYHPKHQCFYVADKLGGCVRRVKDQKVDTPVQCPSPEWIAANPTTGDLYISSEDVIYKYNPESQPNLQVLTGSETEDPSHLDGPLVSARFDSPAGLAFDPNANALIVADSGNNCIRRVSLTPGGEVTTIAGQPKVRGLVSAEGDALTQARFAWPRGVAVDANGTIYCCDMLNHRVVRIDGGRVSTVVFGTVALDDPNSPSIYLPGGIYLDTDNSRILVGLNSNHVVAVEPIDFTKKPATQTTEPSTELVKEVKASGTASAETNGAK